MTPPLLFCFGLHLHQPVGNFDSVFEQHLREVYQPLVTALADGGALPVTLHLSGPLLDWLTTRAPAFLDTLGRHVADGRIELLLAGYDEPILAVLPRPDRLEQIGRLRDAIQTRFGVTATGLWLTERVWEPGLAEDLAAAGVRYVLVDDRHFLVAGFERAALHRPYLTESGGRTVTVFPIDEKLRYLVPFRPPAELADYFRQLRAAGAPLAILADDGEKFGGWPGTFDWVYRRGWMADFTSTLRALTEAGEIRLATFGEALDAVGPAGLAYLPSASYREMEGWSLPADGARRLAAVEQSLGAERVEGPDGGLIRGSHWRHFFVKYPESNRMHKKMLALSARARAAGDPPDARRAIGRAQCNDAYWHGVFGGLYLPHLRHGIWAQLARAEGLLRAGEMIGAEECDLDMDGSAEWWIHSDRFSALVAPARGGGIEELTLFGAERNLADVIARREEVYHAEALARVAAHDQTDGGTASIHDIEAALILDRMPVFDGGPRAIFQESLLGFVGDASDLADGRVPVLTSWSARRMTTAVTTAADDDRVSVDCTAAGLSKTLVFERDGRVSARFEWSDVGEATWFATELSLGWPVVLETDAGARWEYPIETVAKSEKGFDRTVQGTAVVLGWPAAAGRGVVHLSAAPVTSDGS